MSTSAPEARQTESTGPTGSGQLQPLSVSELQQALRMARQQTSTRPGDIFDLAADLADLDEHAAPDEEYFDSEPPEGQPTDSDAEDVPEPSTDARRAGRRRVDRGGSTSHKRGRGGTILRRVLGFDRAARKPSSRREGDDWLTDFATSVAVAEPSARPETAAAPLPDVRIGDAPRGFVALFWRWVARIAVVVLLVTGVNQVFFRPFRAAVPAAASTGIDLSAASQVAARFTADYLTYEPSATGKTAPGLSVTPSGWTGAGRVTVDLVQPGAAVQADARHVLVSVAARLEIARTNASNTSASAAPSSTVTPAVTVNTASPTPISPVQQWVTLIVPLVGDAANRHVAPTGPVFTGEPPAGLTPAVNSEPDAAATAATQHIASTFFDAYGRSEVSYLASPGVTLAGLGGAVQFLSLTGWNLSVPPVGAGSGSTPKSGVGSGTVVWQVVGTNLRIAQNYAVTLTSAQGRWYAAAVGPNLTDLES